MYKDNYISGETIIGVLVFINRVPARGKSRKPMANFRCSCGKEFVCSLSNAKGLNTKSCGCKKKELVSIGATVHGHNRRGNKSKEYETWYAMVQRCTNPNCEKFKRYAELGVTLCERWRSFPNFLEDMGLKPSKLHTLDRIDNTKGYYKENCRWATKKEQQRNREITIYAEYNGVKKPISEWAELTGFPISTLYYRILQAKWDVGRALTEKTIRGKNPNVITMDMLLPKTG